MNSTTVKTISKQKLAKELKLQLEELEYQLLEAGMQDCDRATEIPLEYADKVRTFLGMTREAIAGNPETSITNVPVAAIAQKTGMQIQNIESLLAAIWDIETTRIIVEAQKQAELEIAARQQTKANALKAELASSVTGLKRAIAFNPHEILGSNPEQFNQDCIDETAEIFELCAQIRSELGKGK